MTTIQEGNELTLEQIDAFERLRKFAESASLQTIDLKSSSQFCELRSIEANQSLDDEQWLEWLRSLRSDVKTMAAEASYFKGELSLNFWWGNSGGIFYCYSVQYRICKDGDGGNKANINWSIYGSPTQWRNHRSPDAMWQTCEWISWSTGGYIGAKSDKTVFCEVEFVFDKSGSDPKATATHTFKYE
ncbi:hypothetical protein [Pseudomonas sp. B26(2017)]|uniref:hypothetical protein n=1 Tax=Pseudomonas sp. B26(2017) TaxID=1981732 RepID=UPI00111C304D|nr:hypothetical protein [Pseudomonas sp. B26(2017)]